jgi:hypothetical protein
MPSLNFQYILLSTYILWDKLLTFSNLIKLEDGNLQKSINVYLSIVSGKMNIQRNKIKISMFRKKPNVHDIEGVK